MDTKHETLVARYGQDIADWLCEAFSSLEDEVDNECCDSHRCYELTDAAGADEFDEARSCCGSLERELVHGPTGRRFMVGINYGH